MPPFRLDLTVWALRRRPHNAVDGWDGRTYRRVLALGRTPIEIVVEQTSPPDAPSLRVTVTGRRLAPDAKPLVAAALTRLLGTRTDLTPFYRFVRRDARLKPLVRQFYGFKPPRFPSLFEALVNGFACQQVSLTVGIELLNRLARAHGQAVRREGTPAFPRPEVLARLRRGALRPLGFTRQKSRAVIELARAVAVGRLDLGHLASLGDSAAVARLCELRGVGRWTAELVLLRGLGRLHIFPGDDVGTRNRLQRWLGQTRPLDYDGVHRTLAPWAPYAGLIYFHLLLEGLAEAGQLR